MISGIINEFFSFFKDDFGFHVPIGPRHSIRAVSGDEIQTVGGGEIKRITELRGTGIERRVHLDLGEQLLLASGAKNGNG